MLSTLKKKFLSQGVGSAEWSALCSKRDHSETLLKQDLIRIQGGYPIQYLIGSAAFLDHEFEVQEGVLIPRPETEAWFYEWCRREESFLRSAQRGLEIGVGSGILSVSLLSKFPELQMIATDVSPIALATAQKNAKRILEKADRLELVTVEDAQQILPKTLKNESFDFLISNPPYLASTDPVAPPPFEPQKALFAAHEDPLIFYETFGKEGWKLLRPGGRFVCEISEFQVDAILDRLKNSEWEALKPLRDLRGVIRAFSAIRRS